MDAVLASSSLGAGAEPRLGWLTVIPPMKVRIVESLCIACGLCRKVCPERAVHRKMQNIHHRYEVLRTNAPAAAIAFAIAQRPEPLKNTS